MLHWFIFMPIAVPSLSGEEQEIRENANAMNAICVFFIIKL